MHTYTATDIEVLRYEEAGWEWTYVDDFTGETVTTRTNARGQGKFVKTSTGWKQMVGTCQYAAPKTSRALLRQILHELNK
nr:MAG TPA: hypothetical protein [Caudoviricetes sp.]